ncbi:MAG: RnfABCDGE type electron transport complex subunit D [Firmicutes bacterium]|jgi:electron transport complex protein RnfD|nr:RnfABCDGE type electron transport complex subunit D [Bacillota bacterium]
MDENIQLIVSTAPHLRDEDSVSMIMYSVVWALLPATVCAVYFFRGRAIGIILTCIIVALLAEAAAQRLRGVPATLWDGSALVTGLLLALNLPPTVPWWMAVLGTAVAIVIGKQVFGGLGHNPFNPALVGRAFLLAAFPVQMTTWITPFDAVSASTPLAQGAGGIYGYGHLYLGLVPGSLGETSAFALLLGALYLLYREYIDWRIPVGYLGTVAVISLLAGQDPIFQLLSGGLMLGALFMATDMVTTPITRAGRWIFGIGAGVILMVIRLWGAMPEGVTYSILIMNGLTPLLNRWTRPRIFGHGGVKAHE